MSETIPWDKLKNLLHIGLPAAGEQVSYSLSQVVITYFTVMLGTAALTARTYAMNIILFSYVFSVALGQGAAILIGHLVGANVLMRLLYYRNIACGFRLWFPFAWRLSLRFAVSLFSEC